MRNRVTTLPTSIAAMLVLASCAAPQGPKDQSEDTNPPAVRATEAATTDGASPPGSITHVDMPAVPGEGEAPTVAMFVNETFAMRTNARRGPQLIIAAWADGRVVWSKDLLLAGPPYRQGRFNPRKLDTLLRRLDGRSAFDDVKLNHIRWGPDGAYTALIVAEQAHRRWLNMSSWHELLEDKPTRIEDLKDPEFENRPPEDQRYRRVWAEARTGLEALIPESGAEPAAVVFEYRRLVPDRGSIRR